MANIPLQFSPSAPIDNDQVKAKYFIIIYFIFHSSFQDSFSIHN